MTTISRQEFLLRARLDQTTLEAWVTEEWLIPGGSAEEPAFTDADLARAALIHDLKRDLDVNDAGIGVILGLIDQVHGLRRTLAALLRDARVRDGRATPTRDA
ncbi:MAG TPA: chaperone modulator CbpM [Xanthobacteraceae bacterium]|nr:chaperone modulator CbpM [Xanthobacteraceae bacterium]